MYKLKKMYVGKYLMFKIWLSKISMTDHLITLVLFMTVLAN